jgi:hypothetical protein
MVASARSKKPKARPDDLAILRADSRELVIELSDGTRLFVRADDRLDISVT